MARTIMELFSDQSSYKYGTNYSSVKADTETLIEQETTGIRIKSAVDVNNPLIYGNESTRIAIRSTPSVEKMKGATGGEGGDGGLIGAGLGAITGGRINSLSEGRDYVNSKLGIPGSPIPTYVDGTGELQKGKEPDTMITLGKIKKDAAGTELGKFLKQTGGGNFRTIGRNIIGQGISLVKDKVRDTLFGSPISLGSNVASNQSYEYSSFEPYSTTIRNAKNNEPEEDKLQLVQSQAKEKIDELKNKTKDLLKKNKKIDEEVEDKSTSDEEIYSVKNEQLKVRDSKETNLSIPTDESNDEVKKDTDNKLTESAPFGEEEKERVDYSEGNKYSDIIREEQTDDTSDGKFTRIDLSSLPGKVDKEPTLSSTIKELNSAFSSENPYSKDMPTLESLYGMGTTFDSLNADGKEGENFTRKELEENDLVPVWIAPKGGKSVHFRSVISGLTETVTPGWSTQKFLGNPYASYNYEGVERSLSFNLKMFCYSASELANMWTKIQFITTNCYPSFEVVRESKVVKPPIVEFRIGNMYKSKVSFIESLSYTIPDDSNWEVVDGLQLPKIVEVAITMKFIENAGIEDTLYAYEITDESLKIINEKRGVSSDSSAQFSEEPQTSTETPPPLDNTGVEITEETEKQKDNSGINKAPKDERTGETSPEFDESVTPKTRQQQIREKNRKDLLATGKIQEDATIFSTLVNVRQTIVAGRQFGFNYDTLKKENEEFISIEYRNGNNITRRVFSVISGKKGTTGIHYDKWKRDQAKKQEAPKENNSIETY